MSHITNIDLPRESNYTRACNKNLNYYLITHYLKFDGSHRATILVTCETKLEVRING